MTCGIREELRRLHTELDSPRRLRPWRQRLLRGASERIRDPGALFDGDDAFDGDLWWLLLHQPTEPATLEAVWSYADGRCAGCEERAKPRGVWIERRDDGALFVLRDDVRTRAGWLATGATHALFTDVGDRWLRATIEGDRRRPVRVLWQESADGDAWDPPWRDQAILYDDAGDVLAIHAATTRSDGDVTVRTLFERPVDLPDDDTLMRRAHEDLVAACYAAVTQAPGTPAGARLWHLHGPDGALTAIDGFELCDTLDDLLGEPPDELPLGTELPVIAPWSHRTFVEVLERRAVRRGDNDELDAVVIGVVREVNERLEREYGADGPVVLRCVGWVDEESARPALTAAQRARWRSEGWTARIARFAGGEA